MAKLEHPLKREIEEVRKVVLGADARLSEHVKWNAPSFHVDGEDRVTMNLRGKGFFMLVFHRGAKVKDSSGDGHLLERDDGLLEWKSADRATMTLGDMNDVEAKREKLARIVAEWIDAADR
ncbi:DUF1801 domain-containing protein [Paenibacillaceae bacterium WGS1546]|uniref:DUF1801 domain-containing protein n=1 Tax=Cohnella sp. WGS1546 TaxID=3366810 RepID=UPI00372D33D1